MPSFKVLCEGLGFMGLSSSTIYRICCWECWATSQFSDEDGASGAVCDELENFRMT